MINISVNGVAYPVPSSAADTNWAAQQVRFQQALAEYVNSLSGGGGGVVAQISATNTPADNRTALEEAIALAVSGGSYTVLWPPELCGFDLGVLPITGDTGHLISIPSGVSIKGVGRASGAYLTGLDGDQDGDAGRNFLMFELGCENASVSGIRFVQENGDADGVGFVKVDQNQSSCVAYYLDSPGQKSCHVRDCFFDNLFGFSIHAAGTVQYCDIFDNEVNWAANGINVNGYHTNQSRNRLYQSEGFECLGADNLFLNNVFTDCFTCAFSIGGTVGTAERYHGNVVVGNTIDGMTALPGEKIWRATWTVAVGQYCINNANSYVCITAGVTAGSGGPTTTASDITDGTAHWQYLSAVSQANGILMNNGTCYGVVVGNNMRRCTGTSLSVIGDTTSAQGHAITGNTVINGSSGFPQVYGMSIDGGGKNQIVGNIIRNVPVGIGGATNNDETAFGFQLGLVIGSNDNYVSGNTLGGQNYSLVISSGATGTILGENNYVDASTDISWDSSSVNYPATFAPLDTTIVKRIVVEDEAFPRLEQEASGKVSLGDGAGATDTNYYRDGVGLLRTDGKFVTQTGLCVGNSAAGSTLGTVVKKVQIFDSDGVSLGYLAVYDAIT